MAKKKDSKADDDRPKIRPRPGSRGPAPYSPSDQDRRTARTMAGYGCYKSDIAAVLGISLDLLNRELSADMDAGRAQANAAVGQRFYNLCVGAPAEYDMHGNLVRAETMPDKSSIHLFVQRRLGFGAAHDPDRAATQPGDGPLGDISDADLKNLSDKELETLAGILEKAKSAPSVAAADPDSAGTRAARH